LTLIELILSMVIISIAVTGVLSVITLSVRNSADPLIQQQALAIAEGYMEEILLQAYSDPDGTNVGETRATFDNVADYNNLNNTGAHDQNGGSISNLTMYNVSVSVADQAVAGLTAKKVTVTVSSAALSGLVLVGYRFNN
jgi:MSHA pilin protein MshD